MALGLLALFLVPFSILFNAFVFTQLWEWFVTPFGIMALGMAHAIGLSLMVRFLTHQYNVAKDKEGKDAIVDAITAAISIPLFAWGMGALAHYFM